MTDTATGPPACDDCGEHHHGYAECPYEPPNLARCDYYQGVGSCTFSCWEEPSCQTDCPREGWPDPEWTPYELNVLAARRYAYRLQNWSNWQRVRTLMHQGST